MALLAIAPVTAQSPGQSKAFGKTLGEWMKLYHEWSLGGTDENRVKDMVFLPNMNMGEDDDWELIMDPDNRIWGWSGEMDVGLKVGEKFASTITAVIGELYEDGTADDPDDDLIAWFVDLIRKFHVEIWLDGELIISSEDDDYEDRWYDVVWFDEPIEYAEPTEYGAVAATFITGYGFVHPPLSKGEHTLYIRLYWYKSEVPDVFGWDELDEYDCGYNELTLNITVAKKK
jgi:hypothetical protein